RHFKLRHAFDVDDAVGVSIQIRPDFNIHAHDSLSLTASEDACHDFLIRSRINAIHPPSKPPPRIVVKNSTNLSSQTDPCACIASRIPPWSKMTASAIVAPTTNHQAK